MRCVIARVLPVPAPASTQTGPRLASATWRCSGSRAASRSSGSIRPILPYVSPGTLPRPGNAETAKVVTTPKTTKKQAVSPNQRGDPRAAHDVHDDLVRVLQEPQA